MIERTVLPFRSFVQTPMSYGSMLLAGDTTYAVPPTGAKGLNLGLADVQVLAEAIERALRHGATGALDGYTGAPGTGVKGAALLLLDDQVLHRIEGAEGFDERRRLGELTGIVASRAGSAYLAEGYTGWPSP